MSQNPEVSLKPPTPGRLLLNQADGATVTFPLLVAEILIGRLDNVDLVLDDPAVSRVHAKIVRDERGYTLVDLESTTGTQVNGEYISRHVLCDGDIIEFASVRIEYRE